MSDHRDSELDRRIAELPRSFHPERDLWSDIERRVVALRAPSSLGSARRKVAVVSAAALAAAAALALLIERADRPHAGPRPPPAIAVPSSPPALLAPATLEHLIERSTYRTAVRALEASLAEHRRYLSKSDAEGLEQSLDVFDHAIQATERALSLDPDNSELKLQLWDEYQQKIDALVAIVDLVGRTS